MVSYYGPMRHVYCYFVKWLPRPGESRMKKNEFSEIASNLLIAGSVSVAAAPFLLGDRLVLIVSGLIAQVSNYVTWLVS